MVIWAKTAYPEAEEDCGEVVSSSSDKVVEIITAMTACTGCTHDPASQHSSVQ